MPPRYDPSADRQRLHHLAVEFFEIVRTFCDHEPLLRGNLKNLRRRCGKPRCRCVRGKLHETLVFINTDPPRRTIRKVSIGQYQDLRKPVKRYRTLRRLRARLGRLRREALRSCDRLRDHRLAEGRRILGRRKRH